jgi:hypothetical protein
MDTCNFRAGTTPEEQILDEEGVRKYYLGEEGFH